MTEEKGRTEATTAYSYEEALELVRKEVDRALTGSPSVIREFTSHLTGTRGKFIRAVSLLTCALDGENRIHPNAVKSAAAVEILHLATLVHDDVIDDADMRRGNPTLQKKYGKKTAVICGDYLLCVALRIASSVPNKQDYLNLDLPDYISRVCFGELSQHLNNGNFDLSVYRYLKIISGKTAALFEASFHAGAVMAGCGEKELCQYRRMGRHVGMMFQLIDDCMDFEATESIAKKPVQSDFEQDVVTLPLIHALSNLLGFKEKARNHEVTRGQINEAVSRTGGISYTRRIAKKYYNKFVKTMDGLEMTEYKRNGLQAILDKAFQVF
jgi:heptaprenyl diphosphate synthase